MYLKMAPKLFNPVWIFNFPTECFSYFLDDEQPDMTSIEVIMKIIMSYEQVDIVIVMTKYIFQRI